MYRPTGPPSRLSVEDSAFSRNIEFASPLPQDRPLRIDVSPYHRRLAMDLTAYADTSQINAYMYATSLVQGIWGYQQSVFYSRETLLNEYGNPPRPNRHAQWFGTRYVFLNAGQDPVETYEAAGWERPYQDGTLEIWHVPDTPSMATATTRPAVLVIGAPATDAYRTVFCLANDGMLPYNEALLVEGQPDVDKYSMDELKPSGAVFLYGHDYKDGHTAWDILSAYVEQ